MRAGSAPAASATASSPPVHTSTPSPASVTQRTIAAGEERLARVVDRHGRADGCRGRLERGEDARRARPRVGLVDHVERRAESLGELGGGDAAPRRGGRRRRGARARARPAGRGRWRRRARGAIRGLLRWLPRGNLNGTGHRRDRSRRANPDRFLKPAACRPCGAGYPRVYRGAAERAESVTIGSVAGADAWRGSPRRAGGRPPRGRRSRPSARP